MRAIFPAVATLAPLFNRRPLRDLCDEKRDGIVAEVAGTLEDHVLEAVVDEWAEALAARYGLEAPRLRPGDRWREERDVQFARSAVPGSGWIPGKSVVVHVPFDGDPEIFFLTPNQFTLNPPTAAVAGSDLLLHFEYPLESPPPDIGASVDRVIGQIDGWLAAAQNDCNVHNASLRAHAHSAIERRRRGILEHRKAMDESGIPLGPPGEDKPRIVEAIERRPSPLPPTPGSSEPIDLDPSLPEKTFPDILRAIAQAGRDMERSPATYAGHSEEDRRQILLLALNQTYRGLTTAEAFNVTGKTDLRIVFEGRNLFIAECKIWDGEKSFTDAVDQVLSYGSWHDTKLALVVFVRAKGLTAVIEKAKAALSAHQQFDAWAETSDAAELWAKMHGQGDPQRIVDLAVQLIHTPAA